MQKLQEKLRKLAGKLPDSPGIYKFIGAKNQILYIGKATSLKSRVKSYFDKDLEEKRSPLIAKMVMEAKKVKFEKTDSVLEALLLESSLIKKLSPPYNTADKDQKSFNYVVITDEEFPRVLVMREREITPLIPLTLRGKPKETFGPFPHSSELKEALKIVRKIFPFRDRCRVPSLDQGEGYAKRGVGCFNYQISLCPGVCVGNITKKEYRKTISHIKTFFEGNKKKLIKDLEKEMGVLAKKREFEKASVIKKKIFALQHIQDIALIKRGAVVSNQQLVVRVEAYDIAHLSGIDMVGVMTVIEDGEINKNEYRKFKIKGQKNADDTKALKEVLERRFKHPEWRFPNLIVVDGGVAQFNTAKSIIQSLKLNIEVVAVTKDERHKAKEILGIKNLKNKKETENIKNQILLANSEAHRFALTFHRKLRDTLK